LYVDIHEGRGPYALFVHGILSSRAQWMLNLDALSTVCRPVVVELLGHGRSEAPDDAAPYTPAGYVSAFEAIRESLGADHWLVIGQSLGSAVTLRYSLDHPDRVIAQVFTNSSSALADEAWQQRLQRAAPSMASRIEEGGAAAIAALPIHPSNATRMPDDVKRALVADAELLSPRGVARSLLHTSTSSVRSRVGENRVPTLLVAGGKEKEFEEPRTFAAANMPMLETVVLEAGHAVNIQAADRFNAAVCEFFATRGSS
jgi:pimeloyl-ACP methyl ester carboxylesterase